MKKLVVVACAFFYASSAFAATSMAELESLKKYCQPDVERLCPGVPYGGGAVKTCLKKHEKEVSIGCGEALKKLKE